MYTCDKPNGTLNLAFGAFTGHLIGAPYPYSKNLGPEVVKVKLAPEIRMDCDIDMPINDFDVPRDPAKVQRALHAVIGEMAKGRHVFAGCMGGRGRTGLFFALLAKVSVDYGQRIGVEAPWEDPVAMVREHYYHHAVETDGQYKYVSEFDTTALVDYVQSLQPVPQTAFGRFLSMVRAAADAIVGVFSGRRAA